MSKQLSENQKKNPSRLNAYAKYSGIAVQMMVIIAGGTYGGFRLDRCLEWKIPVFTVLLSLCGVGFAIWYAVKDLLK